MKMTCFFATDRAPLGYKNRTLPFTIFKIQTNFIIYQLVNISQQIMSAFDADQNSKTQRAQVTANVTKQVTVHCYQLLWELQWPCPLTENSMISLVPEKQTLSCFRSQHSCICICMLYFVFYIFYLSTNWLYVSCLAHIFWNVALLYDTILINLLTYLHYAAL